MMVPHYEDDKIKIHKIKCGPYDNNAYLLVCPQTNESIVIDTPVEPGKLIEAAKATSVKSILITHNHLDHIQGFTEVVSAIGGMVGIGEPDASALPTPADFLLTNGENVKAGTLSLVAISTPGHTPGSTCLLAGKHLFTGDTLFPGGPGRTRTPESLKQIIESITTRLFVLGDDLHVYPGHGVDTDLKTAKGEYSVFASKDHGPALCGDVQWLNG